MKHEVFGKNVFPCFLVWVMFSGILWASDCASELSHEVEYPKPSEVLAQYCGGITRGYATEEPCYKTEISFLHQEGKEVITWGPSGCYEADIPIDRYFGTAAERQRMTSLGLMDKTAKVFVPCFDCDSAPTELNDENDAPQRDLVYLNGHYLGRLTGINETATMNTFEVPVEYLTFPKVPGDVANNHLRILVDVANDHQVWYLGQLWQMLVIQAPPPVLLVHGWTREQDAMSDFSGHLSRQLGIPSVFVDVSADDSPQTNATQLQKDLEYLTSLWGVKQFNIVAHSKGGLDSRVLVDRNGLQSDLVYKVLQVATPNMGSLFADVALAPVKSKEKVYSWAAEHFEDATQESESFTSLTVQNCLLFNEIYDAPICPLHTITGQVDYEDLSMTYKMLANFVDLRDPNDGMVTVNSAHSIHRAINASPLYAKGSSRFDHSGIIREGAPDVINAYEGKLTEKPERDYDLPPYRNKIFSSATRGEEDDGAVDSQETQPPNASMETELFALEKGKQYEEEFHVLAGGKVFVGLFPCAPGTQAKVICPDGEQTVSMTWTEMPGVMAENAIILTVELPEAQPGVYHLHIDCTQAEDNAIAKLLVKEETSVFRVEVAAENTTPPSSRPIVTACCFYRDKLVIGGIAMTLRATKYGTTNDPSLAFVMNDDGEHGDGVAGDGVFSLAFDAPSDGYWNLEVEATGDFEGNRLTRYGTACIPVTDATGDIVTPLVETTEVPIGALCLPAFSFAVDVAISKAGRYCLAADLAAPDGTVVCETSTQWIAVGPECQSRTLEFSTEGIIALKTDGPWTVENLRLGLIGDDDSIAPPILLVQSDDTQQTVLTKYSEVSQYDFSIRILGTGDEEVQENPAAISQELVVRMDVEVIGTPPDSFCVQMRVVPDKGESVGWAEGELIQTAKGYQIAIHLGAEAIQSLEERTAFTLTDGVGSFCDKDGFSHEVSVSGSYHTQEYICAFFEYPIKSQNIRNGTNLQIESPGAPDEDGVYKAILRYTAPEEEPMQEGGDSGESGESGSLLRQEKFYVFQPFPLTGGIHLKDSFILASNSPKGEYVNVTEEVQRQLWQVGDKDGVLDSGETVEVAVEYQQADGWVDGIDVTGLLRLRITEYFPTERSVSYDRVFHPFDSDQDYTISHGELEAGKASWLQGETHPRTLLEAVELSWGTEYLYDVTTHRFYLE